MTPVRWTGTENTGRPGCWRVGISETLAARMQASLEAKVAQARAHERENPGVREVIESLTAEQELARFIARHGNGEADPNGGRAA